MEYNIIMFIVCSVMGIVYYLSAATKDDDKLGVLVGNSFFIMALLFKYLVK